MAMAYIFIRNTAEYVYSAYGPVVVLFLYRFQIVTLYQFLQTRVLVEALSGRQSEVQ